MIKGYHECGGRIYIMVCKNQPYNDEYLYFIKPGVRITKCPKCNEVIRDDEWYRVKQKWYRDEQNRCEMKVRVAKRVPVPQLPDFASACTLCGEVNKPIQMIIFEKKITEYNQGNGKRKGLMHIG
jgi:hypothetical protein